MSIKSTIAAVAASPFLLAGAAFAGPYVNVESNLSYPDGEYSSAGTDVHIGYEGGSGKVGASLGVSEDLADYAEVSGISNEDASGDDIIDFGGKLGAKSVSYTHLTLPTNREV